MAKLSKWFKSEGFDKKELLHIFIVGIVCGILIGKFVM